MSSNPHIVINSQDLQRLENLFSSRIAIAFEDAQYLRALRGELTIARVLPAEQIPAEVVTMNSMVQLRDTKSTEIETYTLVYPEEADISQGKLSVLAPIGTAILGRRVGDVVDWQVPSGPVRLRIEKLLFQPEADGVGA